MGLAYEKNEMNKVGIGAKRLDQAALIPVLVTGIQSMRVCASERVFPPQGLGLAGFL
jgi:hypothetical protein